MIQNRQYRIIPTFKMIVEKRFPFGIVISPGAHLNFLKLIAQNMMPVMTRPKRSQHVKTNQKKLNRMLHNESDDG